MSPTSSNNTFPFKLHSMLNSVDNFVHEAGSSSDTPPVTWLPHGRAFTVLDKEKFLTDVIPIYFSQTKMRSFTRQLSLWGFKRVSTGVESGSWYHEHFLREDPSKLELMKRTSVKGASKFVDRFKYFKAPSFHVGMEAKPPEEASMSAKSTLQGSLINKKRQNTAIYELKENTSISLKADHSDVSVGAPMFDQEGTLFAKPQPYPSSNLAQIFNSFNAPATAHFHGILSLPFPNQHLGTAGASIDNKGTQTTAIAASNGMSEFKNDTHADIDVVSAGFLTVPSGANEPTDHLCEHKTNIENVLSVSAGFLTAPRVAKEPTDHLLEHETKIESFQGMVQNVFSEPICDLHANQPTSNSQNMTDLLDGAAHCHQDVPCLDTFSSAHQSFGITDYLDVVRDNRDVSNVEFTEFLSQYFQ